MAIDSPRRSSGSGLYMCRTREGGRAATSTYDPGPVVVTPTLGVPARGAFPLPRSTRASTVPSPGA